MPQMCILKWLLLLFIFFSTIYLILALIMYFNIPPTKLNMEQMSINKIPLTWKW